jgi:Uma2 family endonuclease
MIAQPQSRLYTVDEFEQYADSPENSERLLELIDGEIVEKMPNEEHGMVSINLTTPLDIFIRKNKSGRLVVEVRYRAPGDTRNACIPDIAFRAGNKPLVKRGSVPELPDLAVEIKSPDDSLKAVREKVRYYLANGVRLVWLVLPAQKVIEVYTPSEEFILTEADTLSGGDVLPGFALSVREVFADPMADA